VLAVVQVEGRADEALVDGDVGPGRERGARLGAPWVAPAGSEQFALATVGGHRLVEGVILLVPGVRTGVFHGCDEPPREQAWCGRWVAPG
jgi:hypothetical protein